MMNLPVLNDLEKIYPNVDTGAQAIRKLVKNQNLIEQGIKDAQLIEGPQGPQGETGATGADGNTPFIGDNGNWWIGTVDTGISASGAQDLTEIRQQINVLNNDRGYLNTLNLNGSIETLADIPVKNGKYMFSTQNSDFPNSPNGTWYFCEVTVHNNSYAEYELSLFTESPRRWFGTLNNGVFSGWKDSSLIEIREVKLLNGWSDMNGNTTVKICKNGNHVSFVNTLKNENVLANATICVSPWGFDSSFIVFYGVITFSADEVGTLACLPNGIIRYEGLKSGAKYYVGVNMQYDIK